MKGVITAIQEKEITNVSKGLVAIFLQPPRLAENKENFDFQGFQMHSQSPVVPIKSDWQTGNSSNVALMQTIKLARKKKH